MHSFKDRTGRTWVLDITVATVERVKAVCGVDLPGLLGDRMAGLDKLLADHTKLTAVIFECCRGQTADATIDDLKASWNGATADAAVDEFLEELTDFFPGRERRLAIKKAIQSTKELGAKVLEKATAQMTPETIDATADQLLELMKRGLVSESSESSGSTPDTSPSTPDLSPSASST